LSIASVLTPKGASGFMLIVSVLHLEHLALSGWCEAFKNGHVQTKVWHLALAVLPLFQGPIALINGYVAVVGLAEQLRLVQCAAQRRDGGDLIFEAVTRGISRPWIVT
jgi:hypothetical protein